MTMGEEKVEFNLCNSAKNVATEESGSQIYIIDQSIDKSLANPDEFRQCYLADPLEACLVGIADRDEEDIKSHVHQLDNTARISRPIHKFESLDLGSRVMTLVKPLIEEAPSLELKPLPTYLRVIHKTENSKLGDCTIHHVWKAWKGKQGIPASHTIKLCDCRFRTDYECDEESEWWHTQ
ncbi:hypothetical protein ACLOJK_028283 [Asimina triloba]